MCTLAAGFALVSAGLTAAGSMQQAGAQADAARVNAQTLRMRADVRRQQGVAELQQARRDDVRKQGALNAKIGTTGIAAENFSDILADDAAEYATRQATILWKSKVDAQFLEHEAQVEEVNAKNAKAAGRTAALTALVGAAGKAFVGGKGGSGTGISFGSTFSSSSRSTFQNAPTITGQIRAPFGIT